MLNESPYNSSPLIFIILSRHVLVLYLQVQNHLQVPVDIFGLRQGSTGSREEDPYVKLFSVEPSGVHNVPLFATYSEELFVKPSGSE